MAGNNGDIWINRATGDFFAKDDAGVWILQGNIKGPAGPAGVGIQGPQGDPGAPGAIVITAEITFGEGPPADSDGSDGEVYVDTLTDDVYKFTASDGWVIQTNLRGDDGASFRSGPGAPSDVLGSDGDSYVDTLTGDVYTKAAGTWTATGATLKGDAGADGADGDDGPAGVPGARGSLWYEGAGAPGVISGQANNDLYLNTSNGDVYQRIATVWTLISNIKGPTGATGDAGDDGAPGDDAWTPVFAIVTDGNRRVLQVSDWVDGGGTKPTTGLYVGATGLTAVLASGTDIRGPQGPAGADGSGGGSGGDDGLNGWSPVFAIANDGARRVLQVADWVGGEGTKPAVGDYVGSSGLTSTIGSAVDIRGPTGATGGAGSAGPTGPMGGGFSWTYDSSSFASSGISTTTFRVNDAALSSVTHVYMHANALNGSSLLSFLSAVAASTSTKKCRLTFQRSSGSGNEYAVFTVTAVDVASGSFADFTVTSADTVTNISDFAGVAWTMTISATGDKGTTGTAGADGDDGAPGAPGDDGADGADGSSFLSGAGAPSGGLGVNGDTYLNTTNGDLYGPKSGGSWGSPVGNLTGPTGASGSGGGGGTSQAFAYNFDDVTTDSDPGAGNFRWSQSSVAFPDLTMYIDLSDSGAVDRTSALDALVPSTARRTTLVRVYQNGTSQEQVVAKLMSVTTATGYRKLGLKILSTRSPVAADGTAYTIQFESYGAGAPMGLMSKSQVSGDSRIRGLPGFTPNKIKAKNLTANRAQAVLFNTSVPILIRSFSSIVTSAASTGGNRRIMLYNVSDMRVDGYYGGSLVYDSGLQTSNWASTGARTITPTAFTLPPGQYLLIDAVGAITGTLTVTALNGAFQDGAGLNIVSNAWTTVTDMYFGADLTGTPADPFASGGQIAATFTDTALPTTAGADQFDLCTIIGYHNLA
jgi:hypothetical protein